MYQLLNVCKIIRSLGVHSKFPTLNVKLINDYVRLLDPLEYFVLQGVPIRIEVGPRDMKNQQVVTVRRDTGTKECIQVASDVGKSLGELLKSMQKEMFQRQLYP